MSRLYVVTFIHAFDHQQNVYEVCTAPGLAERRLAELANQHTRRHNVKVAFRNADYQETVDRFANECQADNSHQLYVSECDPKPGQTVVVREPDIQQPYIQETGEPNCVLAAAIQKAVAKVFDPARNTLAGYTSTDVALIHAYAQSRLTQEASALATQLRQHALQREQL